MDGVRVSGKVRDTYKNVVHALFNLGPDGLTAATLAMSCMFERGYLSNALWMVSMTQKHFTPFGGWWGTWLGALFVTAVGQ